MHRRAVIGFLGALLTAGPALADPPSRGGRGRGDETRTRVDIRFTVQDRGLIHGYYGGGGGGLPPGLQRQVDERGRLPPGLQRQYEQRGRLPPGLERRLSPLPPGYGYRVRGNDVLIIGIRDGRIVDMLVNVVR